MADSIRADSTSLTYAPFDRTRLKDQRRLYSLCFPESRASEAESEALYRWQFCARKSFEYAAFEGAELVGYYAALPYRYRIDGKTFTCGVVCDVMTHPQKRNRGIFTDIGHFATARLKEAGVHFTSGYPIRKEVIPGHLKVGWKTAFKLPLYVSLLKMNGLLKKLKMAFAAPIPNAVLGLGRRLLAFFWKILTPAYAVACEELSETSVRRFTDFLPRWEEEQRFYLVKDPDFLSWRLGKKNASYKIAFLETGGCVVGAAVLRVVDFYGVPAFVLLDYMVLKEHFRASPRFLCELQARAVRDKREAVVAMMSAHWSKRYRLGRAGFLRSPYVFRLISKKLDYPMGEEAFLEEKNWHLSWIDTDRF